jgi:hypothetical protein
MSTRKLKMIDKINRCPDEDKLQYCLSEKISMSIYGSPFMGDKFPYCVDWKLANGSIDFGLLLQWS